MSHATYLIGDVRAVIDTLPDGSIDLVLTSSPFLALRSYLDDDHPDKASEIGQEGSPGEFIGTLLQVVALLRPKLAGHGSIVFELGDTYAGSGGQGGDYDDDGIRAGQPGFAGSASAKRRAVKPNTAHRFHDDGSVRSSADDRVVEAHNQPHTLPVAGGDGWPLAKSLCGIPQAFELSLAYGMNVLTGEPSPAGRWIVRNQVAWCRPNPPVGELFDKFRPATSYLTVATLSPDRWFDIDAVRVPVDGRDYEAHNAKLLGQIHGIDEARAEVGRSSANGFTGVNPAGTPPNDWWVISGEPYKGSHYATWPRALCLRPILTMCPERVCLLCGQPSRRIVATDRTIGEAEVGNGAGRARGGSDGGDLSNTYTVERETVGWTECGCGDGCRASEHKRVLTPVVDENTGAPVLKRDGTPRMKRRTVVGDVGHCADPGHWRRGVVLDPFAGSGTTLAVATGCGRDAIGIDLDERNVDLARDRVGPMFFEVDDRRPGATEPAPAVVA